MSKDKRSKRATRVIKQMTKGVHNAPIRDRLGIKQESKRGKKK